MWIIRFHLIKPAHYNLVSRYCKKQGFFPRQIPPMIFIKSSIEHILDKKSWRLLSSKYKVGHIALHSFYTKHKNNLDFLKLLHTFTEARIMVYIGETTRFNNDQLDNSNEFLELTLQELGTIFEDINS